MKCRSKLVRWCKLYWNVRLFLDNFILALNTDYYTYHLFPCISLIIDRFDPPDQFSFFSCDYSPPGVFAETDIVSPESELLSMSSVVGLVGNCFLFYSLQENNTKNFYYSPTDFFPFTSCLTRLIRVMTNRPMDFSALLISALPMPMAVLHLFSTSSRLVGSCFFLLFSPRKYHEDFLSLTTQTFFIHQTPVGDYSSSMGYLTFPFQTNDITSVTIKNNELSTMLTAGRLSPENKQVLLVSFIENIDYYGQFYSCVDHKWLYLPSVSLHFFDHC